MLEAMYYGPVCPFWKTCLYCFISSLYLYFRFSNKHFSIQFNSIGLAVLGFYSKTGFWPSYCQISTDRDKILHKPIVVRNTLMGRLRPRSARGRLHAKPERLFFVILVTHPKSYRRRFTAISAANSQSGGEDGCYR